MLWEGLLCKGKFLAIAVLVYTLFVAVCCDSGTRSIEFEDGESDAHWFLIKIFVGGVYGLSVQREAEIKPASALSCLFYLIPLFILIRFF